MEEINNEGNYTYTKTICNSENKCSDVLIECEDGKVKNLEFISGQAEYCDGWQGLAESDGVLCERDLI